MSEANFRRSMSSFYFFISLLVLLKLLSNSVKYYWCGVQSCLTSRQVFYNPLAESGMLTEKELSTVFINWKELIWCNTGLLKYVCNNTILDRGSGWPETDWSISCMIRFRWPILRLPSKEKVRERLPFSGRDYRYLALKSFSFLFFIEQHKEKKNRGFFSNFSN